METTITLKIIHDKPLRKDFVDTVRNRVSTLSEVEGIEALSTIALPVVDMVEAGLTKELKEMR